MDQEELQSKYQRLGQEYQKTRAQVTVLKKAVLDEQATNKILQDTLKQRDQSIRKYEQDIDSLQFRNSQLSKRVEILQNELDEYERKGVKPSKQVNSQTSISFIHEQELQMKIAENESLHKQLQEANQQHELTSRQLESRVNVLEHERANYEKSINDCNSKNSVIVERMKEEQALLEGKLHKKEEDLKFANIMAEKYSQQLKEAHKELRSKLEKTNKLIQEKMPFIDTENPEYNKFNVPVCDRNHQHKLQLFLDVLTDQLIVFMAGLSDYHTYLEQRLKVYSVDIMQEKMTPSNTKFSTHLLTNASYSRKVQGYLKSLQEQAQKEVFISLDTLTSFQDVAAAFHSYVKYLEKLMSYRIISIDEECRSATWSESLEKCNNTILKEEKNLNSLFLKLNSYVSVLASSCLPSSSLPTCVKNVCATFGAINNCLKALCGLYIEKASEEHNLPTYTERLKTTDECLLSTLHSLNSTSSKLFNTFKENLPFLSKSSGFMRKGLPSDNNQSLSSNLRSFFNNAASYVKTLQQPPPQSVPYSLAIKNYRVIVTSTADSDSIKDQATSSQETIVRLEQEKEHLLLEAQLLKAKYEREQKSFENYAIQERNRTLQRSVSSVSASDTPIHQIPFGTLESYNNRKALIFQTNLHEKLLSPRSCQIVIGSVDSDHESLVKDHLSNRIAHLTKQLQVTDSKCINFYHEAHSLYKQIILADKNKQKLTNEVIDANKKIDSLQDELETTKRSYEEQLRMLSDHLCGMNEKLTSQKDEIDELKTTGGSSQKFPKFQLPGRKK